MHTSLRREGSLLLVLIVFIGLTWWWQRDDSVPSVAEDFQSQKEVDGYLTDFVVTTMNELGQPSHRLVADRMVLFSGTHLSQVDQPFLTLYRQDATPWLIYADNGLVQSDTDTVFLTGNVRMTNKDDLGNVTEVLTDSLEVQIKKHFALTEHQVRVNHYQGYAQGLGLEAYLREGRLTLLDQVRSRYEAVID